MRKLTQEQFISRVKKIYKNKYDYSNTVYVNKRTKITVKCHEHGFFSRLPYDFQKSGCPKCGVESSIESRTKTTKQFIKEVKKIHKNKYGYNKIIYRSALKEVILVCSKHGDFNIKPSKVLNRGDGCPKCGVKSRADKLRDTVEEFIVKANKTHDHFYDYKKVEYINQLTKIKISCPYHGYFEQTPGHHLQGEGCPKCADEVFAFGNTLNNLRKSSTKIFGLLYVIECYDDKEHFYKIGITTKTVKRRFKDKKSMPYEYQIIMSSSLNIFDAFDIEQYVIEQMSRKDLNYNPKKYFGGVSECLSANPIDNDAKLKELFEEQKYFSEDEN